MLTACPGPGGRDSWQPPPPGRKERPACPGLCVPLPAQDAADRLRCPRQHPFLVPLHSTATGRTVPRPQASRSPHSSSHTWGRTRPPGPLGAALVHSCSPRAAAACPLPSEAPPLPTHPAPPRSRPPVPLTAPPHCLAPSVTGQGPGSRFPREPLPDSLCGSLLHSTPNPGLAVETSPLQVRGSLRGCVTGGRQPGPTLRLSRCCAPDLVQPQPHPGPATWRPHLGVQTPGSAFLTHTALKTPAPTAPGPLHPEDTLHTPQVHT